MARLRRAVAATMSAAALAIAACEGRTPESQAQPSEPVWFDDFNVIDPSEWYAESAEFGSGNGERQIYDIGSCSTGDSALTIRVTQLDQTVTSMDGRTLTHASCFLRSRQSFGPGNEITVRARTTGRPGLHPAVWLRPVDRVYGAWPESGEIDLFERINQDGWVQVGIHSSGGDHPSQRTDADHGLWHVHRLRWTHEELVFSVDEREILRLEPGDWDSPAGASGLAPFDRSFNININVAVGGRWPGPVNDDLSAGIDALEIDWIEVRSIT